MSIQAENLKEAYYETRHKAPARRWHIVQALRNHPEGMMAEQILEQLMQDGIVGSFDPNFCRPRLTELCDSGIVEAAGKRKSLHTGKNVTVWRLAEERPPVGEQDQQTAR